MAAVKRGLFDRSFKPVKVPIHCEALYDNILSQCKQVVWSDDKEIDTHRFYLADGSGASIYAGGNFELTSPLSGKRQKKDIALDLAKSFTLLSMDNHI